MCRRCGKPMDKDGNVIGEMVFGEKERSRKLCNNCQKEMEIDNQWPDR